MISAYLSDGLGCEFKVAEALKNKSTGELRLVKIVSEGAIAAGTRRIELVVSNAAVEYLNNKAKVSSELEARFKVHTEEVIERVEKQCKELLV
mgnify:CR=1 FL=1